MNCAYCKDKLSAYIDNELSPEERFLIEEHVQVCPSCAREAETLHQLGVLFESIPEETPSPAFVQRTVNKAAVLLRRSLFKKFFLDPARSLIRSAVAFVFVPDGYGADGERSLASYDYLRTFGDSPPGSFADVYLIVIQGGGN